MTVNVLLSEALLPPAISSWSSRLLLQIYLQDGDQWICFGERNLQNFFTETVFCFELDYEQTYALQLVIVVRVYDGFKAVYTYRLSAYTKQRGLMFYCTYFRRKGMCVSECKRANPSHSLLQRPNNAKCRNWLCIGVSRSLSKAENLLHCSGQRSRNYSP